jgi:aspartyl-tRNA(Asn)/glutamyl-tRNA(Gln) amidotransferase subunit B
MDLESFLETTLPELPENARHRLQSDYGLSDYLASVLTGDPPAIKMFDIVVEEVRTQLGQRETKAIHEMVANLLCNELFALVRENETQKSVEEVLGGETSVKYSKGCGEQLGEVVALLAERTISNTMAKQLLKILHNKEHGKKPRPVASERGFQLITDPEALAKLCRDVINESPEKMERYKLGER